MKMSNVYLATHLEKAFGGMREAYISAINHGSFNPPDKAYVEENLDVGKYAEWVGKYITGKMATNKQVMYDVIGALYRSYAHADKDSVYTDFNELMQFYLQNVFQDKEGLPDSVRALSEETVVSALAGFMSTGDFGDVFDAIYKEAVEKVIEKDKKE